MLNKLKFEVFGKKRDCDISTNPGDPMKQTYRKKIDESGKDVLVPDEYYDVQPEIDSYEDSVNVNTIISRYMAGDESALDRAKAFYADVSKVPKNFAQILDINNRAMQAFSELPSELKEAYGFSYYEFLNNPQILDDYINNKNQVFVSDEVKNDAGETKESAD